MVRIIIPDHDAAGDRTIFSDRNLIRTNNLAAMVYKTALHRQHPPRVNPYIGSRIDLESPFDNKTGIFKKLYPCLFPRTPDRINAYCELALKLCA
ncbi:MAG: hypothetical protein BWY44_00536 [Candidatus Omnitrophica bacterium ADurb.Bin292]|nr:MAG: hypothetical protein BWY44_00536 [Candidatus Omnitrophica bacterium ADurb.Bin292]